jgi:transposase-like protein
VRKNARSKAKPQQEEARSRQLKLGLQQFIRDTLLETVLTAGFEHVKEVFEQELTEVCGPRYQHAVERAAYRYGSAQSSVVLGGRRVRVTRPRARTTAGEEIMLPSWGAWSAEDPLDERAIEQMLVGVSTRKYRRSLEPLPPKQRSRGASRSAVSRRFVRGTTAQLRKLMERDLSGLDLTVLMLDGVHFIGEHVIIVAVGIDAGVRKHVLGLWEGATENKTSCTALLEELAARGLRTDRSILVVLDGSKALYRAVRAVFGNRALIQRCQEHKKRNVLDALPQSKRASVKRTLTQAFRTVNHVGQSACSRTWPAVWTRPTRERLHRCARDWRTC